MIGDVQASLYNARRPITEGLQHGAQFVTDFAEIFLTLARAEAQLTLLRLKLDAMERTA
jgi:hypothetical protein